MAGADFSGAVGRSHPYTSKRPGQKWGLAEGDQEWAVDEEGVWSHFEMEHLWVNVCFLLTIQNTFSNRGQDSSER